MHYVLVRNQKPRGDSFDIEDTLRRESPGIAAIFDRHRVAVGSIIPSTDGSRFIGQHEVVIPELVLEMMHRELNRLGYRLEGFSSRGEAARYWATANREESYQRS